MDRNKGFTCNSCGKSSFQGQRFRCLICYNYVLCKACQRAKITSSYHAVHHPMQCITPQKDYVSYYRGKAFVSVRPQFYTCPYCSRIGFDKDSLIRHVNTEHIDTELIVLCPICATTSANNDENLMIDDLPDHLIEEHIKKEQIIFPDEPADTWRLYVKRTQKSLNLAADYSQSSQSSFSSSLTLLPSLSVRSTQSGLSTQVCVSSSLNTYQPLSSHSSHNFQSNYISQPSGSSRSQSCPPSHSKHLSEPSCSSESHRPSSSPPGQQPLDSMDTRTLN
ncbi:hypothetical protein FQA39_LY04502 [Lamprigera yunnana]|nr:hypothetical protein FQA39_LY04502 [Lamprigera yunnana]